MSQTRMLTDEEYAASIRQHFDLSEAEISRIVEIANMEDEARLDLMLDFTMAVLALLPPMDKASMGNAAVILFVRTGGVLPYDPTALLRSMVRRETETP